MNDNNLLAISAAPLAYVIRRGMVSARLDYKLVPAPIFRYAHATRRTDERTKTRKIGASVLRPSRCVREKYGEGSQVRKLIIRPHLLTVVLPLCVKIIMLNSPLSCIYPLIDNNSIVNAIVIGAIFYR